jgi:predicted metal-dependent hydrolase
VSDGADGADLAPDAPARPTDAPAIANVPARIVDSDGRAKVYRPLDVAARRAAREAGIAAFEEGRFFEAHELMEPDWMGSPDPAERDLDQGLIKLAAAYVHAERGNALGMRKNLAGARRRLTAVEGPHGDAGRRASEAAGVDASEVLRRVDEALAALDDLPPRAGDLLVLIAPHRVARIAGHAPIAIAQSAQKRR